MLGSRSCPVRVPQFRESEPLNWPPPPPPCRVWPPRLGHPESCLYAHSHTIGAFLFGPAASSIARPAQSGQVSASLRSSGEFPLKLEFKLAKWRATCCCAQAEPLDLETSSQ